MLRRSGESLEDQHAKRNAKRVGLAHEISEVNNECTGSRTRGRLCYLLAKNLGAFCLCLESLVEVEFKPSGLSCLGGEECQGGIVFRAWRQGCLLLSMITTMKEQKCTKALAV